MPTNTERPGIVKLNAILSLIWHGEFLMDFEELNVPINGPGSSSKSDVEAAMKETGSLMAKLLLTGGSGFDIVKCREVPVDDKDHCQVWLKAKNWARDRMIESPKEISDFLADVARGGESKVIDIIVVSKEASSQVSGADEGDRVAQALGMFDKALERYLKGQPWTSFWSAPEHTDPKVKGFIDELRIPKILNSPSLLLHNLGSDIVDKDLVDKLFNAEPQFLANTSGSGKTRLLFEGLHRHWGFYFTMSSDRSNYSLGSVDLKDAIRRIFESDDFELEPTTNKAYLDNEKIARRHIHSVLIARFLVFQHFLAVARRVAPARPMADFRPHWLFLQLCSRTILGDDVFSKVTDMIKTADVDFLLLARNDAFDPKLSTIQDDFDLDPEFFLVLDEAQIAALQWPKSFRSEALEKKPDEDKTRPVLRPIVRCLTDASGHPLIISGTGLNVNLVSDVFGSAVGKPQQINEYTDTGTFDRPELQRAYIKRYVPPELLKEPTWEKLLERAWTFIRGRHRFTALLVGALLQRTYVSPHKTLNEYVQLFSAFRLTDSASYLEKEVEPRDSLRGITRMGELDRITKEPYLITVFSKVLYKWVVEHRELVLDDGDKILVDKGFARFVDSRGTHPGEHLCIDEPLVIFATLKALTATKGFSLIKSLTLRLDEDNQEIGELLEQLELVYLACAFDGQRRLCDVFNFGDNVPLWAQEKAKLGSIVWDNTHKGFQFSPFHLPSNQVAVSVIGDVCEDPEATVRWFDAPTSLMCQPDVQMGPDLTGFVQLEGGPTFLFAAQRKFRAVPEGKEAGKDVQESAIRSVDPDKFFVAMTANGREFRERVLKRINRLWETLSDDMKNDPLFSRQAAVLSVAGISRAVIEPSRKQTPSPPERRPRASKKARRSHSLDFVTIRIDEFERVIDVGRVLEKVASKRAREVDGKIDDERPNKRRKQ